MAAAYVLRQYKITSPVVLRCAELPLPPAVSEYYIFFFYEFVVFILGEIAEVVASLIPPPAPLNFIELYLHVPVPGQQVPFAVQVHQLNHMLFSSKQVIKWFLSLGYLYSRIAYKRAVWNRHIVYAETSARFKHFGKQVRGEHTRR